MLIGDQLTGDHGDDFSEKKCFIFSSLVFGGQ